MRSAHRLLAVAALTAILFTSGAHSQEIDVSKRLEGFDAWMEKTLEDWNAPAVGVGIVSGDRLVFAKGYGFRDYEKKLPFTPKTLAPIASNSKLFTAVAAGLLVDEGQLEWDTPIRDRVPSIRFHDDELNRTVSLRDMLSHRTGITRHDFIWYKSDFTRRELFERLVFMEPKEPLRQIFLYNNMMYAAAGYIIELKSGKTWEEFIRERILAPLEMGSTVTTIAAMQETPDHGVPFTERRDSSELYQIPYYEDTVGVAPAGAIISNIDEMSHWLIALMNEGQYAGKQVIPGEVLKATMQPALAMQNTLGEARGFWELVNSAYGMGRWTGVYRGHILAFHGGDINGFHSQVSMMPQERIGAIVFVIGDHCASLYNTVSYNVYERLLGMSETPWSERWLDVRMKGKEAGAAARSKAGGERVPGTKPSHDLGAYAGPYEHPAYGVVKIGMNDGALSFEFHDMKLPLSHFHYDRFDTPDDEEFGKWSLNFGTNPQGDVDEMVTSLDEAEVSFTRRPEQVGPEMLQRLAGTYETPTGVRFQVALKEDGDLYLVFAGQPDQKLLPYKELQFHVKDFADLTFEFVIEAERVTALKQVDPSGEYVLPRK